MSLRAALSVVNRSRPQPTPPRPVKVAAVIPAYNEAERIAPVIQALAGAPEVDEVIVVSDGSTDNTYAVASSVPGVRAFQLRRNVGKGGALRHGASQTNADVLIFFDADLIGLTPQHVRDLVQPICAGEADMAMGIFKGGRFWTDIAQYFSPGITGQRAIRRDVFMEIPFDLEKVGYGIELAITYYVRHNGYRRKDVTIRGVTHPMKEEKLGLLKGSLSRGQMYWQMLKFRIHYETRLRNRSR